MRDPELSPWVGPDRTSLQAWRRGSGGLLEEAVSSRWANEKEEYNKVLTGGHNCPSGLYSAPGSHLPPAWSVGVIMSINRWRNRGLKSPQVTRGIGHLSVVLFRCQGKKLKESLEKESGACHKALDRHSSCRG